MSDFLTKEVIPRAHLIVCFCEEMTERNWDDKRLYIRDQARLIHGLAVKASSENDDYKALFEECQLARDEAGFLGSVPDCIRYLDAEFIKLRDRLDIGPQGEDAIDVAESAMGHLHHQIAAKDAEIERLRKALEGIRDLEPAPFNAYPADWKEQIAACEKCQDYKDHPIMHGICDTHRRPMNDRESHDAHQVRSLGYRAKGMARDALNGGSEAGISPLSPFKAKEE